MDDISRELEKEISKSKPKPLKKNRTFNVLIVDDDGNIRYGNRYKALLILLSILSIISICISILFFHLYSSLSEEALSDKADLVSAKKKIEKLSFEREQLIAKLVLLGEEPKILNYTEDSTDREGEQSAKRETWSGTEDEQKNQNHD
jgi:hypothetical protein